jgi:hypothetical protein
MLTIGEKRNGYQSFIRSDKFGTNTWTTIQLFQLNRHNILLTVHLYGVLIKRLDEGDIPHNLPKAEVVRVKQHIFLDIIMKIEILIESTLVLAHSLSSGYHTVAHNMTFYDFRLLHSVIENIRRRKYDIRKILGLPDLSTLALNAEEKSYLEKDFSECGVKAWHALNKLAEFYEKYRLVYGKSKHGLTIQSGHAFGWSSFAPDFDKSLLICYDRKKQKQDMPKGYHTILPKKDEYDGFYNAVSYLKFNQCLITELSVIQSILRDIISVICSTHMAFATNCGEGYLPYVIKDEKIGVNFCIMSPNSEDEEISKKIAEKIIPNMNVVQVFLGVFGEIAGCSPEFLNSMVNDPVTNTWVDESVQIKNPPKKSRFPS